MSTTLQAMQPNRSWCEHCVKGRGRASPHALSLKESCQKLESTTLTWGQKDPK